MGVSRNLYVPVIKAVGIAVLVHITAQVCRDAGGERVGQQIRIGRRDCCHRGVHSAHAEVFTLLETMLL